MASPLPLNTMTGIVGAGTMGAGIAQIALLSGHSVVLVDEHKEALSRAQDEIEKRLRRLVEKEQLDEAGCRSALERFKVSSDLQALSPAALVIEAIFEDLVSKQDLFGRLEKIVSEDALLTTNTSSISVSAIASALLKPERFAGLHFFNPAPLMKLVEVVHGLETSRATIEKLAATARGWGKIAVIAKSTPGFIVNRVARPFYGEAFRLLSENATSAWAMDAIFRDCGGFRMGPFELADLIGHDINAAVTKSVFEAFHQDRKYQPSAFQEELVTAGRLGRKTGRGIYDYSETAHKAEPPEAPAKPAPIHVVAEGDIGPLATLLRAARNHGVTIEHEALGSGQISMEGAALKQSDGRLALEHSIEAGRPVALMDLCLDMETSPRIVVAFPEHMTTIQQDAITGFLQAAGKKVSIVRDLPGLILLRTISMLANEAADAVHQGVATAEDIDNAMCYGVNYPRGPLAWAESLGISKTAGVIGHLQRIYGEDRYRLSPELHKRHLLAALN